MAKSNMRRQGHPDFRHRVPGPLPSVAEIEVELHALLTPALLAPRQLERRDPRNPEWLMRLRARMLTLPVIVALVGEFGVAAVGLYCGGAPRRRARWAAVGIPLTGQ